MAKKYWFIIFLVLRVKLLLIMKIIPPRQYQNSAEENLLRRLMLFILKIKINYIYVLRSPPKKFTTFSLHNAPVSRSFLCKSCYVFGWKMINKRFSLEPLNLRSTGERHLELTCENAFDVRFCWATLHLSGSIKDFLPGHSRLGTVIASHHSDQLYAKPRLNPFLR